MSALEDERAAHQICVEMRDTAYREIERLRALIRELHESMNSEAWIIHYRESDLGERVAVALGDEQKADP